jgi:uncharacterized protein YegJ (DUF2314 family)
VRIGIPKKFTSMRVLFIMLVAVVWCTLSGCSRSKEGDNFQQVGSDDAGMNAAVQKAKGTAGDFVRAFHAQNPGATAYFVKKPYPTPSGNLEHMWIEVVEEENGVMKGRVANEAEETKEVKAGQMVSLKISEISDWKYQDGKKLVGGFTIKYFIERMSPKEREAFLKETGYEL